MRFTTTYGLMIGLRCRRIARGEDIYNHTNDLGRDKIAVAVDIRPNSGIQRMSIM